MKTQSSGTPDDGTKPTRRHPDHRRDLRRQARLPHPRRHSGQGPGDGDQRPSRHGRALHRGEEHRLRPRPDRGLGRGRELHRARPSEGHGRGGRRLGQRHLDPRRGFRRHPRGHADPRRRHGDPRRPRGGGAFRTHRRRCASRHHLGPRDRLPPQPGGARRHAQGVFPSRRRHRRLRRRRRRRHGAWARCRSDGQRRRHLVLPRVGHTRIPYRRGVDQAAPSRLGGPFGAARGAVRQGRIFRAAHRVRGWAQLLPCLRAVGDAELRSPHRGSGGGVADGRDRL